MLNPFRKAPAPVAVTLRDHDTDETHSLEAVPGTPEFAAAAKQAVDAALLTVKEQIGPENWDQLCTVMFSCMYDNENGIAQSIDGNSNQLLSLMAVTMHQMAEVEVSRQKLLPKPMGGNKILALYLQKLAAIVNLMDKDGEHDQSSIITQ